MTDPTAHEFRSDDTDDVPPAPEATGSSYPPEADPDNAGDVAPAEVPGEQTDPTGRLTGGDLPVDEGPTTPSEHVTPGSTEPPD